MRYNYSYKYIRYITLLLFQHKSSVKIQNTIFSRINMDKSKTTYIENANVTCVKLMLIF